ncbi:polysaccharide biosynthesis protein [Alkalibacillus aidingensis]|uniref:polysaccharide biosynthesis protein n=1 Tax=Alkalibacillus aidingensis TaxID=2747607 RepID=UPI00166131FB|nr:polysaccharide biosynthesis protein [Alkalibacillus aidingensis]
MIQEHKWIKGTVILAFAGFIGKVLGMVYRIPLQNLAGDEGLYIYQQIYPLISLALILSIYSLPSAYSHVLAHHYPKNAKVRFHNVSVVFYLLLALGIGAFLFIYFFAPLIANLMGDPFLSDPIKVSSFMFLIIPITSFFRGYFQKQDQPTWVATSQVMEQLTRVVLIVVTTVVIVQFSGSLYQIGLLASLASVVGALVASVWLVYLYRTYHNHEQSNSRMMKSLSFKHVFRMFSVGIVVYSITHILHLLIQAVDVFTMIHSLRSWGSTFEDARVLKGIYDRGNPLIQLGLVFGAALAFAIVPTIQKHSNDNQHHISEAAEIFAVKLTYIFSLAASLGLIAIMPLLNPLFYQSSDGTKVLQWMMLLVFLLSMIMTLSVLLQAYGERLNQLIWLAIMVVGKGLLNMMLINHFGLVGASFGSLIAATLLCIVFFVKWHHYMKTSLSYGFLVKGLGIGFVMFTPIAFISYFLEVYIDLAERLLLLVVVLCLCLIGALIVIVLCWKWRYFNENEQDQLLDSKIIKNIKR